MYCFLLPCRRVDRVADGIDFVVSSSSAASVQDSIAASASSVAASASSAAEAGSSRYVSSALPL